MKQHAKRLGPQMNLPLLNPPATTAAAHGKPEELILALMELLINAAQENRKLESGEGSDECETYD